MTVKRSVMSVPAELTSFTILLTNFPPTFSSTMTIVRRVMVSMINVVVTHSAVLAVDGCNS